MASKEIQGPFVAVSARSVPEGVSVPPTSTELRALRGDVKGHHGDSLYDVLELAADRIEALEMAIDECEGDGGCRAMKVRRVLAPLGAAPATSGPEWVAADWDRCCTRCHALIAWEGDLPESEEDALCTDCALRELDRLRDAVKVLARECDDARAERARIFERACRGSDENAKRLDAARRFAEAAALHVGRVHMFLEPIVRTTDTRLDTNPPALRRVACEIARARVHEEDTTGYPTADDIARAAADRIEALSRELLDAQGRLLTAEHAADCARFFLESGKDGDRAAIASALVKHDAALHDAARRGALR